MTEREQLIAKLDCDQRSLSRWQKLEGAPLGYALDEWRTYVEANGLGRGATKTKTRLQEDKLRREIRLADLRISREEGESLAMEEMEAWVAQLAAKWEQLIKLKFEVEAPMLLQGKSIADIRAVLKDLTAQVRAISNSGLREWKPPTK